MNYIASWLCDCGCAWIQSAGSECWNCHKLNNHRRIAMTKEKASPDYAMAFDGDDIMLAEEDLALYGVYI